MSRIDEESGFKVYSIGIVVEDKLPDTKWIKVWPSESLSLVDGKLSDYKRDLKSDTPDSAGTIKTGNVTAEATLLAMWLPFGTSNRSTAPDVRKNESVIIFRFGDTDQYYWTEFKNEEEIRQLEHVVYRWSNTSAPLIKIDDNNSYWLKVSTRDKYIHIHTSNNDGEAAIYDIMIDTKSGTITIQDDVDNRFLLDSKARHTFYKTGTIDFEVDTFNCLGDANFKKTVNIDGVTTVLSDTNLKSNLNVSSDASVGGMTTTTGFAITGSAGGSSAGPMTAPVFNGDLNGKAASAATADCC